MPPRSGADYTIVFPMSRFLTLSDARRYTPESVAGLSGKDLSDRI